MRVVYSVVIAVVVSIIAFYTQNGFLKFANLVAWCFAAFFLYKNLFYWTNRLDMSDDLKLWGLRILGGVMAFVGLLFGGIMFFGSLVGGLDPLSMGLSVLFFGAGVLGAFMLFRTNRRYGHLYVNR